MSFYKLVLAVVGIAIVTVVGDYFIKLASMESHAIRNRWFVVGCAIYILCTVGWVFVMPHMKLASIGVVYSLSMTVLMALLGILFFGESLNKQETFGLALAFVACFLLRRVAG